MNPLVRLSDPGEEIRRGPVPWDERPIRPNETRRQRTNEGMTVTKLMKALAAVATVAVLGVAADRATANEYRTYTQDGCTYRTDGYCTWKQVVTYQWVTTYEIRQEAYEKTFTLYDECYRPYTVTRTLYRDVKVPVKKQVAVTKWVKVCY